MTDRDAFDTRPTAEQMLERVKSEATSARGRLRVYLGMAPGVGKTFRMLEEGHRRVERGTDLVVGFVEAHGLAVIFGVLLWTAEPKRMWHLTAMAIHTLLGTCNLVFWQIFIAADMLPAGYLTTSLHAAFAALQATCAFGAGRLEAKAA